MKLRLLQIWVMAVFLWPNPCSWKPVLLLNHRLLRILDQVLWIILLSCRQLLISSQPSRARIQFRVIFMTLEFIPRTPLPFSGYALASRPNSFQQQALQFVEAATLVDSCQLPAVYPMPSYYPVQQPQFVHYQPMPSHIYPLYILPVGQTQVSAPSNLPAQWDLHNAATGSLSHPLPQVAYKEVTPEPRTQEFGAMAMKSADGVQQQPVNISNDAAAAASGEVACTHNECRDNDDDDNDNPERTLIYKSQPPPPPPLVPSQLQSNAQATTNILSDAMSQLQMIQTKP
ncbi:uncharacterized protein LOC111487600 isoform X2 [Cucurbita maxima]|uniref:Uncharacterized protein LOC111487600 isoform X1 n=1 Tax=Cucurbita maxima TaxID=3661 RepID=A0A6J1JJX9_CUCMA|nr:uncharacterized protein LOC111487600 isoform X1 [Cucurbita maxima]XP_022990822.1 uncharacterized protein LOC111487600 isoform X2 [Cucurbita maxima]